MTFLRVLFAVFLVVVGASSQVLVFPITGGSAGAGQATNAIGSASGKGTNVSLYGTTSILGPMTADAAYTWTLGTVQLTDSILQDPGLNADFAQMSAENLAVPSSSGYVDITGYLSVNRYRLMGVTNAGNNTNLVVDYDGPSIFRAAVTNVTTVTFTNVPAKGTKARQMVLQLSMPSPGYTVYFQTAGTPAIDWQDGLGPALGAGRTNHVDVFFDGTNALGSSRQEVVTGNGYPVLSNAAVLTDIRIKGSNLSSNRVWTCTNSVTGEGEWRERPRTGVYRTITVGAAAFATNLTAGALLKQEETVANAKNRFYLEFMDSSAQAASYSQPMPEAWDRNYPVEVKIYWSSTNAQVNRDVRWAVATDHTDDDDPVDYAYGTEVEVTDTISAYNDLMITSVLAPTPGHSAGAAGALLDLRIRRLPANAADNTEGAAKVYAVVVRYKETEIDPVSTSW